MFHYLPTHHFHQCMIARNRQADTLTTLRLINCALDDAGLDRLLLALARCPNLTCLDLGDNLLTGRGVQALATTVLQPTSRLLTLNLAGNPVDADGWVGLTAALHANIPLQQLDVSRTGFKQRGHYRGRFGGGRRLSSCT